MPFESRPGPQVPMAPFPQRISNDPVAQRLTMHSVYNSLRNATAKTTAPVMGTGNVPYLSDPEQQEKINNLLAPFGARLPEPDEIKQNFLLPEAGSDNFFGQHPNLTRGIEGALLGAATTHGGQTIGDSIQGVAQSVLGIPALRQQHIASQMLAPFAQANQVAQLQSLSDQHALRTAQTADYNAQANLRAHPIAKYSNFQKDADGNLWGQNEATGQVERVPLNLGGVMAPDFSKPERPNTPEQQFMDEFIKKNPKASLAQAQRAYVINQQPPQHDQRQLGVDANGKVIELKPGMVIPQGTKTMNGELGGAKATADEARRADLARNLSENLDNLEDIVTRRPELFGPYAGRLTAGKQMFGTGDPDVAALKTIEEQTGLAMVGAHAMRNAQHAEKAAQSITGANHNQPSALLGPRGSIQAARDSLQTFLKDAGQTTTGKANPMAPPSSSTADDAAAAAYLANKRK